MARPAPVKTASDPERRCRVLSAAEKLFRHYGIGKTTIGDVAREAGIGVGSVYLEFSSKDEIVSELATARHDRVLGAMREASQRGSFAERLARALEARIRALFELSREGAHSCDLVACPSNAVKAVNGHFREEELAFVASLLEAGTRAGELEVSDPAGTAELLQRAHASFSPPGLFERPEAEALERVRAMNELLLRGLVARDGGRGRPRRTRRP